MKYVTNMYHHGHVFELDRTRPDVTACMVGRREELYPDTLDNSNRESLSCVWNLIELKVDIGVFYQKISGNDE